MNLSRFLRGGILALFTLLVGMTMAFAHSGLQRAEPQADSRLAHAPKEIRLHFSEPLEPAFSKVEVVNEQGARASLDDSRVDRSDRKLLRVGLQPLPSGSYSVIWHVLSIDSHVTQGRYRFQVE